MPVKTNGAPDVATEKDAKAAETVDNGTSEADLAPDDADSPDTSTKDVEAEQDSRDREPGKEGRRINWSRLLAFGLLPALALLLTMAAAFFKWQDSSMRASELARTESVQAARDATVALLSYQPDTVGQNLGAARELLTGTFQDEYTKLTQDMVIPGARQQHISATASVPAAASVSAAPGHAVVLLFVNQTTTVGTTAPTDLQSSVRVTLEKVNDRWLVSAFDPV